MAERKLDEIDWEVEIAKSEERDTASGHEQKLLQGMLDLEHKEVGRLKHVGIKEFLKLIQSHGLFNGSLRRQFENLGEILKSYQKSQQQAKNESKTGKKYESIITGTVALRKKVLEQIFNIKNTLNKTDKLLETMTNSIVAITESDKKLTALAMEHRKYQGMLKQDSKSGPKLAEVLQTLTGRSRYILRKRILQIFEEISASYKSFKEDILEFIDVEWKKANAGREEVSMDEIMFFEQNIKANINKLLRVAEMEWYNMKKDKDTLDVVEAATIQALRTLAKKAVTERKKPLAVSIAKPNQVKPKSLWEKAISWLGW